MSAICILSPVRYVLRIDIQDQTNYCFLVLLKGRIISLCDDNSLDLWEIVAENAPTLKCVQSQSLEGK